MSFKHIEHLERYAMAAACENIAKHGTAGLVKPIPYPVYLKCIVKFAEKYSYDLMLNVDSRNDRDSIDPCARSLMLVIRALDHCILDHPVSVGYIMACLMQSSDYDVDGVNACLHRFAYRCLSADKIDLLTRCMKGALKLYPCKLIRHVLVQYGAELDPDDANYVMLCCRCGDAQGLMRAINTGKRLQVHREPRGDYLSRFLIHPTDESLRFAIDSGDMETIKVVVDNLKKDKELLLYDDAEFSVRDLDIKTCDLLLELGVFQSNHKYRLLNSTSIHVLQWFIDHRHVQPRQLIIDLAERAVRGGPYVDVLHYAVEHAPVPDYGELDVIIPRGILHTFKPCLGCDLGVVDYLIAHGAEIAPGPIATVLLMRYWLDKGIKLTDTSHYDIMSYCMSTDMAVEPMDMYMDLMQMDVNISNVHDTLLNIACGRSSSYVELMLEHGADPNGLGRDGKRPLHVASAHDAASVSLLLEFGANVDEIIEKDDRSPLYIACQYNKVDIVDLLLNSGADVDSYPLSIAVSTINNVPLVRCLLSHGADIHGVFNRHVLYDACTHDIKDIAEMLIKHGANVDGDGDDKSPLVAAVTYSSVSLVELLLVNGANVKCATTNTLLGTALTRGNVYMVSLLLKHGVDPNERTVENEHSLSMTPLEIAYNHDIAFIEILLNNGANPNDVGSDSLLKYACDNDQTAIVKLLINHGANVDVCYDNNDTPLLIACRHGNRDLASYIIEHGGDVDDVDDDDKSPLYMACENDHRTLVNVILSASPTNVNAVHHDSGYAPLHFLCLHGDVDVVYQLLEHGGDVNVRSKSDETPLHIACNKHGRRLIEALVFHGAEINAVDGNGDTPLSLMCRRGICDCVHMLIEHGANVNVVHEADDEHDDYIPLYIACTHGWTEIVKTLVHHGADVNAVAGDGGTALHRACTNGWRDIAEVLMQHGADVYHKDNDGDTPRQCLGLIRGSKNLEDLFENVK